MLEICESISDGKPSCEIHPLGIGGKADPVRLVFNVTGGAALNASLIDMATVSVIGKRSRSVKPKHKASENYR
jgi:L-arabinose isomerase